MVDDAETSLLVDWPREHVLRVRLHRPSRRNAVDAGMLAALGRALQHSGARAVVMSSSTPGVFCAGADLGVPDAERAAVSRGLYDLYRTMVTLPAPVVAALSGPAVGGGAQLAVASDLRVAEPSAWLRFVGPAHGLAVGAWALPALIGRGRALDLCLTGRRVGAVEAETMGLVDRVADDAMVAAVDLAEQLAALDAGAVARVKSLVGQAGDRETTLRVEAAGNAAWGGRATGSAPTANPDV